jgi:hypothetical protein
MLGNTYIFKETAEIGVSLVLVIQNVDDGDLWYAVPWSMYYQPGTWDVETVYSDDYDSGILHTHCGLWIHVSDLPEKEDMVLPEPYVKACQKLLSAMVSDEPVERVEEVDCDPDYQELIDNIRGVVNQLEDNLKKE